MAYGRAAVRYAKSYLQLAAERGVLEEAAKDMALIHATCSESKDLVLLLESPIIRTDKKLSILEALFKAKISDLTFQFLTVITQKKREGIVDDIAEAFQDQYLAHKNILKAVVKSVNGLDATVKAKVASLVKTAYNKEVELIEEIDPEILGGFVLTIGDQQVDASVSRRLAELRKEFSENAYVKDF